jgi:glucans biosynthesis protein
VRFWVDFAGPYLNGQKSPRDMSANISVGKGASLVHQSLEKNPFNGSWRVAFALKPDGSGKPVELRCFLQKPPHILTETWSYLWNP